MNKNFEIAVDGTLIRKGNDANCVKTEEEKLMKEYNVLDYEIHHLTRSTKDPEKIARYEELKKTLNIDEDKQAQAFEKARQKVLEKINAKEQPDNSVLKQAMLRFKKEKQ